MAEWLRRGPAKAVGYACVSSNLTGVVTIIFSSGNLHRSTLASHAEAVKDVLTGSTCVITCVSSSDVIVVPAFRLRRKVMTVSVVQYGRDNAETLKMPRNGKIAGNSAAQFSFAAYVCLLLSLTQLTTVR